MRGMAGKREAQWAVGGGAEEEELREGERQGVAGQVQGGLETWTGDVLSATGSDWICGGKEREGDLDLDRRWIWGSGDLGEETPDTDRGRPSCWRRLGIGGGGGSVWMGDKSFDLALPCSSSLPTILGASPSCSPSQEKTDLPPRLVSPPTIPSLPPQPACLLPPLLSCLGRPILTNVFCLSPGL